jgi:hypothetical protein
MSHVSFAELDVPHPDCHLGIGGGSHARTPIVVTAHTPFTFAHKRRVQDMPRTQPAAATGPGSTKAWSELHPHRSLAKLGEICREMLNDREAIVQPLLDPACRSPTTPPNVCCATG